MSLSRAMSRADLPRLFGEQAMQEAGKFVEIWFQESSQRTLRQLVERLTHK